MCGRFTIMATFDLIVRRFNIKRHMGIEAYDPNYNVAPGQQVLAVINDGEKNRLGFLRWGLIPPWAKDEKIGWRLINARAESIDEKPSFRDAYRRRRCLIVADGFYEWNRHESGRKTPYRIKLKSGELFAMAGLWAAWKGADGKPIYSCTIVTTEANDLVKNIHNRMPVILDREAEQTWINPSIHDRARLGALLKPYQSEQMEMYQVSTDVNAANNNFPDLINRV